MTYIATYFRGNPQSRNGGYNITRIIDAKTLREATKKAGLLNVLNRLNGATK